MNLFCRGEGQSFSEDQFLYKKDGTLFVPHIHKASPPHYAATGQAIRDSSNTIPGPLLRRLHETLTRTSIEEIEELVKRREH